MRALAADEDRDFPTKGTGGKSGSGKRAYERNSDDSTQVISWATLLWS